jgi:hypothetical protein
VAEAPLAEPVTFPARRLDARTLLYEPVRDGRRLTRRGFFEALRDDPGARAGLQAVLRDAPFQAVFWENAPLARSVGGEPHAFVVVDAPALARARAELAGFAKELAMRPGPVAAFENLRGDCLLVVPRPVRDLDFVHVAAFARNAPLEVADALWARVGEEALRWDRGPVWVSTSGLGVSWLHVRLDVAPKYYSHGPYRVRPS